MYWLDELAAKQKTAERKAGGKESYADVLRGQGVV